MKSYGHINFQQNQIQQVSLEVETNFPDVPTVGRLVFKDKILYICAEIAAGIPVWIPLTNELNTFIHNEISPQTIWNITHNLDTGTPLVQVYNQADNSMVIPQAIDVIDNNNVKVTFGTAIAGRGIVMAGATDPDGLPRDSNGFEFTQTTLSSTWTIPHGLGYIPTVRVFVGNQEILPDSISHPDIFTTIITFTSAQTGIARLV